MKHYWCFSLILKLIGIKNACWGRTLELVHHWTSLIGVGLIDCISRTVSPNGVITGTNNSFLRQHMAAGNAAEVKLPLCCISHEFYKAASKFPDKVAVIHASGFAQIASDRASYHQPDGESMIASSSRPPVYDGDECFTFSDILSAVENLSPRLRQILNGGDDPYLIKPRSGRNCIVLLDTLASWSICMLAVD